MAKRSRYYVKSPTRVDLAGGTLDLWPLWAFYGPCLTINIAINIFTMAELVERLDRRILLNIEDIGIKCEFESLEHLLEDKDPSIELIRSHLGFWMPEKGFELRTKSESPVGGGLGGSSSLSMTLIKLMSAWLNLPMGGFEMVTLASNIEAKVLHKPTGVQDYYPALEGGLSRIEFTPRGTTWKRLDVNLDEVSKRALLIYTGRPHRSGLNNWQVLKEAIEGNAQTEEALRSLNRVALKMSDVVERSQWKLVPDLLKEEFHWRVRLSPVFSSPEIERLEKVTVGRGALAAKICGAGGGGCVMLWCEDGARERVAEVCMAEGFDVLPNVEAVKRLDAPSRYDV